MKIRVEWDSEINSWKVLAFAEGSLIARVYYEHYKKSAIERAMTLAKNRYLQAVVYIYKKNGELQKIIL